MLYWINLLDFVIYEMLKFYGCVPTNSLVGRVIRWGFRGGIRPVVKLGFSVGKSVSISASSLLVLDVKFLCCNVLYPRECITFKLREVSVNLCSCFSLLPFLLCSLCTDVCIREVINNETKRIIFCH